MPAVTGDYSLIFGDYFGSFIPSQGFTYVTPQHRVHHGSPVDVRTTNRMARQRLRPQLGWGLLALLLLVQNAARGFGFVLPSNPTTCRRESTVMRGTAGDRDPEQPVLRSRARRQLASFDRRGAVRAGSALALGLAVLGSTSTGTGSSARASDDSSSAAQAAAAPLPPFEAEPPQRVDLESAVGAADAASTLLVAEAAEASASSSRFTDFVSGLAGGAASRASKELLLHPLDTIRVRVFTMCMCIYPSAVRFDRF